MSFLKINSRLKKKKIMKCLWNKPITSKKNSRLNKKRKKTVNAQISKGGKYDVCAYDSCFQTKPIKT
jgi:hypothetical protein